MNLTKLLLRHRDYSSKPLKAAARITYPVCSQRGSSTYLYSPLIYSKDLQGFCITRYSKIHYGQLCFETSSKNVIRKQYTFYTKTLGRCLTTACSRLVRADREGINASESKCAEELDAEDNDRETKQHEVLQNLEILLSKAEVSTAGVCDTKIGEACLRLAELCDYAEEDPKKVMSYGLRAFKAFGSMDMPREKASCLYAIGYAYFRMDEFDKAQKQLDEACLALKKLTSSCNERSISTLMHAIEILLGQTKMSMGKYQESLVHFSEAVVLHESTLEPGNPELGATYTQAAQAYKEAKDPHEAICLCLRALEIYKNYYGADSLKVVEVRRLMSVVYFDLGEFEDALLEYELSRPILERSGRSEEVVSIDLASVETLFQLEKYDDAISRLKDVIKATSENSLHHVNALILLARSYAALNKNKIVDKCCSKALDLLLEQRSCLDSAITYVSLALVYQREQEYDKAASVYRRALEIYRECAEPQAEIAAADIEGQIGVLLLQLENTDEALSHLESSVAKKKLIHGPESEELLDVYNHLGVAYSQEGKLDEALQQFEAARNVIFKNLIETDALTISIYSNLANMYSIFGRFSEAIDSQQIVVEALKSQKGIESMVTLKEAEAILDEYLEEHKNKTCNEKH